MDENKPKRKKHGGRVAGTPNKTTTQIKQAIMKAFNEVGGEKYLIQVAQEDPKTFCALLGKVLPAELNARIDANITYQVMSGIDAPPGSIIDAPPGSYESNTAD